MTFIYLLLLYREKLSKVRAAVESGDVAPAERDRVRRLLSAATSQVESARRELEEQKRRGSVTDRYWSRVEDARHHFQVGYKTKLRP